MQQKSIRKPKKRKHKTDNTRIEKFANFFEQAGKNRFDRHPVKIKSKKNNNNNNIAISVQAKDAEKGGKCIFFFAAVWIHSDSLPAAADGC